MLFRALMSTHERHDCNMRVPSNLADRSTYFDQSSLTKNFGDNIIPPYCLARSATFSNITGISSELMDIYIQRLDKITPSHYLYTVAGIAVLCRAHKNAKNNNLLLIEAEKKKPTDSTADYRNATPAWHSLVSSQMTFPLVLVRRSNYAAWLKPRFWMGWHEPQKKLSPGYKYWRPRTTIVTVRSRHY